MSKGKTSASTGTATSAADRHAELAELVKRLGLLTPTPEQARVATYPAYAPDPVSGSSEEKEGAPLLVVAGAGSGKTHTLALRATYLAAVDGIAPEHILGLTFTRKAAAELVDKLQERLQGLQASTDPLSAQTAQALTYNSFALSIVQEFGAEVGLDPQLAHLGEGAAWQLMREVVAETSSPITADRTENSTTDAALELRDSISSQALTLWEAGARLRNLEQRFLSYEADLGKPLGRFHKQGLEAVRFRLELLPLIEQFDAHKRELGLMDYADQVSAAIKVVEESPQAKQTLRDRHRVVFLDEFQDTSVGQMRLLSALFHDHPVTAVGDPNQAIYGWRGASAASLQDFHPMFNTRGKAPRTTLTLSTAWRNDTSILQAANMISGPLRQPSDGDAKQAGAAGGIGIDLPLLRAAKGAGPGRVKVLYAPSKADEIKALVDFVADVRSRPDPNKPGRTPTVAVLGRRRQPLRGVVDALREAGIPAQLVGGDALLQHPAVTDLRAALEVASDIGKSSSLMRLLGNLDLGAADLKVLGVQARRVAKKAGEEALALSGSSAEAGAEQTVTLLLEAVEQVGVGRAPRGLSRAGEVRIGGLAQRLRSLRSASSGGLVQQVEKARGVFNLDAEALADPTAEAVGDVLDQFSALARDYEATVPRPTMAGFLSWLDAADERERGIAVPSVHADPDAVQVMTVHASKGLEWDGVAVVDMELGRFPNSKSSGTRRKAGVYYAAQSPLPQAGWWTAVGELPYPARRDHEHLPDPQVWDADEKLGVLEALLKERVGAYLEEEERRLAYVAVTRARHDLLLSGAWYDSGRTPLFPSPYLTEVAADLTEGEAGDGALVDLHPQPSEEEAADLIDFGESATFPRTPGPHRVLNEQAAAEVQEGIRSYRDHPGGTLAALEGVGDQGLRATVRALLRQREEEAAAEAAALPSPHQILDATAVQRPISVTDLAAFAADPEGAARDLLRPVPQEPSASAFVGTAFHQWVESHLARLGGHDESAEEQVPVLPELLDEDEQRELQALAASFLSAGPHSDKKVVALESPFQTGWGPGLLRGRVDAVFQAESGDYTLVDWKTRSRLPSGFRKETLAYYRQQLAAYLAAWGPTAQAEGAEVSAELVFVTPQGVATYTFDQIQAALAATDPALGQKGL